MSETRKWAKWVGLEAGKRITDFVCTYARMMGVTFKVSAVDNDYWYTEFYVTDEEEIAINNFINELLNQEGY